jgi:sec-independent protein translocase protein TatC
MTLPDDSGGPAGATKPFLGHLEDLRRTLLWSLAALAAGVAVAIPAAPWILSVLGEPLRRAGKDPREFLRVIEVTGGISIAMSVVLWSGLLLSAPLVVFFVCRFVFPGLTRMERRVILQSVGFAAGLFAAGVLVGYHVLLGVTLKWLFHISAWMGVNVEFARANDYVPFVLKLLLALGLAFEFPVVILILARLELVTAAALAAKRRHVMVVLLLAAAVITPTVDPVTQTLLAAPLYLLYELCIWLVWAMERYSPRATR